jgi:type II secretory pathway component PulL
MSKINHFFILISSFVLFVILFVFSYNQQKQLQQDIQKLLHIKKLAFEYNELSTMWHKKNIIKSIMKVASKSNIKNISYNQTKKEITFYIKKATTNQLDRFVNDILNDSYQILQLDIAKTTLVLKVAK